MTNALITTPHLQRVHTDLAFRLDALMPWQHADVTRSGDELALQAKTLLYATGTAVETASYNPRPWRPNWGQVKLAMITLIESGLNLSPSAGLCCLLSFWNDKQGEHNVQPYVMRQGLENLANQCWTITGMSTVIGIQGDEWDCRFVSGKGWSVTCVPGNERGRIILGRTAEAMGYDSILGVATDIYFADRDTHTHILQNPRLREKLTANRNANNGYGAWKLAPTAMIENMSQREALKGIPLTGQPLASRMLRDTWDVNHQKTQLHLQQEAMARQLPPAVTDDIESIDVSVTDEPVPDMPEGEDGAYAGDDEFKFVPQDAPK